MEVNNPDTNIETNNNIDTENLYYVQQFKRIPNKIRKKAQYINIFTYNFKPYHIAIGININLLDDYQKYKWKSPILNIGPNTNASGITSFDYSNCKLILHENCLPDNR
jgi:hypothetical protein